MNQILCSVIGLSSIVGQVLGLLMFSELDEYSLNGNAAIEISLVGEIIGVLIASLVLEHVTSKTVKRGAI